LTACQRSPSRADGLMCSAWRVSVMGIDIGIAPRFVFKLPLPYADP
jgi:hypothetical protein